MYQIRAATPADAAIITHHRRRMFVDAGRQDNRILDVMAEHFKPWVESRLADGRYFGWLTIEGGKVVAGAGLIILDWPPHPLDPRQDKRGYLLNVYVEPEHRRKRLASLPLPRQNTADGAWLPRRFHGRRDDRGLVA